MVLASELTLNDGNVIAKGSAISKELIDQAKNDYLAALANNSEIDIELGREAWALMKAKISGVRDTTKPLREAKHSAKFVSAHVKKLKQQRKDDYRSTTPNLTFVPSSGAATITVNPYWGKLSNPKEGDKGTLKLKDETLISGVTADSSIALAVDGIDFRHTVMKAEGKRY